MHSEEEEGGSNFQVALILGHTLSWVKPHWQQECTGNPSLGLFRLQTALLKTEDSETKPTNIAEVLIIAKCDKLCSETYALKPRPYCVYLTLAQKNSWMFKDSCTVWKTQGSVC